jgi:PQQ-dependent catabolism-associated CXXCW motif protein
MKRLISIILFFTVGQLASLGYAQQSANQPTAQAVPFVSKAVRERWDRYETGKSNKSFAISENGSWGSSNEKLTEQEAVDEALSKCETFAQNAVCITAAINDKFVIEPASSEKLLNLRMAEKLKTVQLKNEYAKEQDTSMFVKATDAIRSDKFHSMTPPSINGGQVMTTKELRDLMLSNSNVLLIDVLNGSNRNSLPNTLLIPGAGEAETTSREKGFADALQLAAKDKTSPIVFFCLSYECWLSYNAALRAIKLGYTNVIWYRGGIESWKAAGLPLRFSKVFAKL